MKSGILYALKNKAWDNILKCGSTSTSINKRITNLQTSLIDNCELVYTTEQLVNVSYYEHLLKRILKNYRYRPDREFYDVDYDNIQQIYDFFNEMNETFNTEELLLNYMLTNDKKYYNNKYGKYVNNKITTTKIIKEKSVEVKKNIIKIHS